MASAVVMRASMGPWLRSHGRADRVPLDFELFRLQWGRGFAATEEGRVKRCGQDHVRLQWGRGFAATEGGDFVP